MALLDYIKEWDWNGLNQLSPTLQKLYSPLAALTKLANEAVDPRTLPGYTPIPHNYIGNAYGYVPDGVNLAIENGFNKLGPNDWRQLRTNPVQKWLVMLFPSLTPFEGANPGYRVSIEPDEGGFLGGFAPVASILTGGISDVIQGNAPGTGLGNFAPVMNIINPGITAGWQATHAKDAWDFIDAVFDPITGQGVNAIAGWTNQVLKEVAPEILPYATTLGTTLGTIIGGPIGAAAGYGIGSKIAGMPTGAGMIGSGLALGTAYGGQALSGALGGLTDMSMFNNIPVDAWGAGMSTPNYTATAVSGLLPEGYTPKVADELGLLDYDAGLPDFSKLAAAGKDIGTEVIKAAMKMGASDEPYSMPSFMATNQMFMPNYTTTGNTWETPTTPEAQLKAAVQQQLKKKASLEDEPKKDTRLAYLKDWLDVPARPEFLSDYLA